MAIRRGGIRAKSMSGNLSVKLEGDWDKLMNMIDEMPIEMARQVEKGMHNAAKEYKRVVRLNFRTHGVKLGYVASTSAMSGNYYKYKQKYATHKGLLMFSGRIHNSIKVMRTKKGTYTVGISRKDQGKGRGGLTVYEAAYMLEKGTKYAKPYPVFKDSFSRKDQFGGKKRILRFITRNVSLAYKRRYGFKLKIR